MSTENQTENLIKSTKKSNISDQTNQILGADSNIDFNFILEQEGFETQGYVPEATQSNSGVTIASGFDLGARNENDLKGLPQDIIDTLKPYLGVKGTEAENIAGALSITKDQANTINEFAKKQAVRNLRNKWEKATGTSFNKLPKEKATVLASVAFQYGDLESETPNFWNQTTNNQWMEAYNNLLNFGDIYKSRRKREAEYLKAALN
jgi:hypothetical protein